MGLLGHGVRQLQLLEFRIGHDRLQLSERRIDLPERFADRGDFPVLAVHGVKQLIDILSCDLGWYVQPSPSFACRLFIIGVRA